MFIPELTSFSVTTVRVKLFAHLLFVYKEKSGHTMSCPEVAVSVHVQFCVAVLFEEGGGTFCNREPRDNARQQGYCCHYQQAGDKY
jgi:hypothetical protein